MAGLALGSINADRIAPTPDAPSDESDVEMTRWILRTSMVVAAVFLFLRYSPTDQWFNPNVFWWLTDKWHLGAARVINFAALAVVLVRYGSRVAMLPFLRPLALLGQASIEVFSVHILFCLAGDALSREADPHLPYGSKACSWR